MLDFLRWFSEYDYLDLANLQSIISILIGMNVASPVFLGVIKRMMQDYELLQKNSFNKNKALKDTVEDLIYQMGDTNREDLQKILDSVRLIYELAEHNNLSMNKMMKAADLIEGKAIANFPRFMIWGLIQIFIMTIISIINVKVTPLFVLGLLIILLGTAFDSIYYLRKYLKIANSITDWMKFFQSVEDYSKQDDALYEAIDVVKSAIEKIKPPQ